MGFKEVGIAAQDPPLIAGRANGTSACTHKRL